MKIEAQSLTLDRAEIRAILTTASADPCRVNLHGVLVDPSRGVLVSTDGHRMTVASASGPRMDASAVVLPRTLLDALAKAAGAKDTIAIAWNDAGECTATYGLRADDGAPTGPQSTTGGTLSSNAFPPWRAVFPSALHPTRVPLTMNAAYVAEACGVLVKLHGKCTAQVTCYGPAKGTARRDVTADQDAELGPVIFGGHDADRGTDWRIVVMPMRAGSIPDWRIAPEPAAEPEGPAIVADGEPVPTMHESIAAAIPIGKGRKRKAA